MRQGRHVFIKMNSTELANQFAEEVTLLMVDAVVKEGKEAVAQLTEGFHLIDLARHFSQDELAPLYPKPGL